MEEGRGKWSTPYCDYRSQIPPSMSATITHEEVNVNRVENFAERAKKIRSILSYR